MSLGQLKVMSAIERCRTAALGGHVERQAELLPVPYFHVASVTTASSPTPTGQTTSHWPAGSSAYHTRLPGALTAIARTVVTKTKSGIFVLAAVGVWSPSRPSSPAASRDWGPFQQSASTAHDQHAPVAIPTLPRQFQADVSPATASLRQPQLSAPTSTAKTQIAHYNTTVPIRHTATKTNAAVITQPRPCSKPKDHGIHRR